MESIENEVLKKSKKCGRGMVFFADRFARLANADRLHKAMELLTKRGDIIRRTGDRSSSRKMIA